MKNKLTQIVPLSLIILLLFSSMVGAVTADYSTRNGAPYEQQQISELSNTLQSLLPQTIIDGQECSVYPDITSNVVSFATEIVFPPTDFPKAIILYKYNQGEDWKFITSIESPADVEHTLQLDSDVKYVYEVYLCSVPVATSCNPSDWELESCISKDGTAKLVRTVQDSCQPLSDFPREATAYRSECYDPDLNPEQDGNFCVNANRNGCINRGGALNWLYEGFFTEDYLGSVLNQCFDTEEECKEYVKESFAVVNPELDISIDPDATEMTEEQIQEETKSTRKSFTKDQMLILSKSELSLGSCTESSQCTSRGEGFTDPICSNPEKVDEDIDLFWSDDLISFFKGSGICYVEEVGTEDSGILEDIGKFIQEDLGLLKSYKSRTMGILGVITLLLVFLMLGGRR